MTDKTDWREYLKPDEQHVLELEKRASELEAERQSITDQMHRIRNRCAQRRRYAIGNVSEGVNG